MRALTQRSRTGLLLTTAIGTALTAGAAMAQNTPNDLNNLQEVVVTATRQADTVNRVPLAVTAQTQKNLDQQGIHNVRDLQSIVPSLSTTQSLASGASTFSIRGVGFLGSNPAGASPVGFYLDDIALQKRNVGGGVATSNGTPIPPLFDLERVEVLRGPQGTLFGGGSEGGTIRYIQPEPSLTRYSVYARAQYSTPKKGDDSYEGGVAVGGPIIQDKLGFRASVFAKKTGGFIDRIDPLSQKQWATNSGGEGRIRMMRLALAYAPSENAKITLSYFSSRDESHDISTSYTPPLPNGVVVPTTCFNTNNTPLGLAGFDSTGLGTNTAARGGPSSSLTASPAGSNRINPAPVARGDAACAARAAAGDVTYTLPGFTYGPYNTKRYQSVSTTLSPSKTNLDIASATFDYHFQHMSMKAITTILYDQTKTVTGQATPQGGLKSNASYFDPVLGKTLFVPNGPAFNPVFGPNAANTIGYFVSDNHRSSLTEEIRFSSEPNASPLSWVGGVFYSNIRGKAKYDNYQPLDFFSQKLYGLTALQRYGVPAIETAPGLFNNFDRKRQTLKDVEVAAFAEANYMITDKLKATAGIRYSRVSFDYAQSFTGPVTSVGPANLGLSATGVPFNVPNAQNGGANSGSTTESPITPKFGLSYNLTDKDLLYVTAAKGFRAGGVNSQVSYGICQTGLDLFGYLPGDLPQTYKSDTVWSYEAGAKLRVLDNRVQINGDVYRIDWKNPQFTTPPPQCGLVSTFNVPAARSEGAEVEVQALLFKGLNFNGSFGYTNSRYTQDFVLPGRATAANNFKPINFNVVVAGQKIPIAPYTFSLGLRYEFEVMAKARAYFRGDYRYASSFAVAPFPASSFTLDSNNAAVKNANIRAGVEYRDFDINIFVNNLLDRDTGTTGGGRTNCTAADCSTFAGYTPIRSLDTGYPREVGLQIVYRH